MADLEKTWEILGDIDSNDYKWLKGCCQSAKVETEEITQTALSQHWAIGTTYFITCTTVNEKQETLLLLKFGDRAVPLSQTVTNITNLDI